MTWVDSDVGFGVNVDKCVGVDVTATGITVVQPTIKSKQQPMRSHIRYLLGSECLKVN